MDLNNLTYSVGEYNITTGAFDVFSILGPISLTCTVITNVLLLISLLSSASLRRQFRVQLIVCMAVWDLTSGVISTGIFSYTAIIKVWNFGCPFHYLVQIIGVYADIFFTTWYLVIVNATFFVDLMQVRLPQLSPLGDKIFRVLVICCPIFLFCVVGLSIIFSRPGDVRPTSNEFCPLYLEDAYEITMSFVCFFIPATSIVIFCVVFVIFRNDKSVSREVLARSLLQEPTMIERPLHFLLPSLSVVFMGMPEQLIGVLFFAKLLPLNAGLRWLFLTATTLEIMRQWVLPLTWLIFPDIRQAFKDRLSCKNCNPAKSPMTVTNFSYKNLEND